MAVKAKPVNPKTHHTSGKTSKSGKKNKNARGSPGLVGKTKVAAAKASRESKVPKGSKRKLPFDVTSPAHKTQAVASPAGTPAKANGTPQTPKDKKIHRGPKTKMGNKRSPAGKVQSSQTPRLSQENGIPLKKKNRQLINERRRILKKARKIQAAEKVICPTKFVVKFKSQFVSLKDPAVIEMLQILSSAKAVNNTSQIFMVKCKDQLTTHKLMNQMMELPENKKFNIKI